MDFESASCNVRRPFYKGALDTGKDCMQARAPSFAASPAPALSRRPRVHGRCLRRMGLLLLLLALPLAAGAVEMFMDLRTDYAPTTQFTTVRVQVIDTVDNRKSWHQITGVRGTDPAAGMRIGRFDHIESGRRYYVQIELLDSRMRPVDGRLLSLIGPRDRRVITTVISRR